MSDPVAAQLSSEGQTAVTVGKAATVVQILNGVEMLLTFAGIVPAGTVSIVANGLISIFAGVTSWWAKKKAVKVALNTAVPPAFSPASTSRL